MEYDLPEDMTSAESLTTFRHDQLAPKVQNSKHNGVDGF